jgi:hypothetical protein
MYEHPQYFTKNGFKRLPKNPYSDNKTAMQISRFQEKARAVSLSRSIARTNDFCMSEEAAQLIAKVIKGMLHSRR